MMVAVAALRRRSAVFVAGAASLVLASTPLIDTPTPTVFEEPAVVRDYQSEIAETSLYGHVAYLASDALEGRETGTKGQRAAAQYLASTYRELGLLPPPGLEADSGSTGAYLQEFVLYGPELYQANLHVERPDGADLTWKFDPRRPESDIYLAAGAIPGIAGPLEFSSERFRSGELDYEDYAILHPGYATRDAAWVLGFAPDDLLQPADTVGPYRSTLTAPRLRLNVRQEDGPLPLGYILIASPERVARERESVAEVVLSVGRLSLEPGPAPLRFPPVYVVTPDVADSIIAGSGYDVAALREIWNDPDAQARLPLPDVTVASHIDFPVRTFETENVAAYIEGIDPELKNEFIVISAHFDHVGVNPLLHGDTIYNGADDNASGNAAMIEIAEAFIQAKRDGHGPRRSIAFVHFTGEEKGLLGSRYYADMDPLFPMDYTVTNINLDMIGRTDPAHIESDGDYVYVIGSRLISDELHEIADRVNALTELDIDLDERFNSIDDPNQFFRRSDQWNFGKYGVPFIFFFTGTHEDYHRPTDEVDHVDFERLARITRLIFGTTWQLANQDARPALNPNGLN